MGSKNDKTRHKNIRVITKHLTDCMQKMSNPLKMFWTWRHTLLVQMREGTKSGGPMSNGWLTSSQIKQLCDWWVYKKTSTVVLLILPCTAFCPGLFIIVPKCIDINYQWNPLMAVPHQCRWHRCTHDLNTAADTRWCTGWPIHPHTTKGKMTYPLPLIFKSSMSEAMPTDTVKCFRVVYQD